MKQRLSHSLFVLRGNHGRFHSDTPMMRMIVMMIVFVRLDEILNDADISKAHFEWENICTFASLAYD